MLPVKDCSPLGRFDGPDHQFPIRIYFEDTDMAGVVYYANYLRFMERARSDMLRGLGIAQRAAFESGEGVYVVSEVGIKYLAPAHLDDDLTVVSRVLAVGAATATIQQRVIRGEQLLTDAKVTAAFLTREGRPRRQPKAWVAAFKRVMEN